MTNVTAYIFKEDRDRLVRDVGGRGGSLFGQWTSTGNPVVHVAISSARPETSRIAQDLSDNFKLCHIGEWRPVAFSSIDDSYGRKLLISKFRGKQEAPSRFLVLDVSSRQIVPYLFVNAQERAGTLEILEGQNPFNIVEWNLAPYQRHAAAANQEHRNPGQVRSQSHEAETSSYQWYAHDNGNQKLQYVYQAFQNIAQSHHVEMSRDTVTHDMSMIFTDQRNGKRCEVKFPFNFPRDGAWLTVSSLSPIGQRTHKSTKEPDNRDLQKAVERIISVIQKPGAFR